MLVSGQTEYLDDHSLANRAQYNLAITNIKVYKLLLLYMHTYAHPEPGDIYNVICVAEVKGSYIILSTISIHLHLVKIL